MSWKASAIGLSICISVGSAFAGQLQAPAQIPELSQVVVTGSRTQDTTSLSSSVPVDVISGESLRRTGFTDLGQALEALEPGINLPRGQTTPTAANTRAITLRGLSPDEVLVLVDGKRWHSSAVINTNFAVGRGSAPFDLSTIPVSAIARVEVLRDGAAAEYGSDAIAGVINIILKSNDSGGSILLHGGATEKGDGVNGELGFNHGFASASGGRLTVSGDVEDNGATNRAQIDQRYGRITYRIGDPTSLISSLAMRASQPIDWAKGRLYGDFIFSRKSSTNTPTFRPPGTSPLYPNGYQPHVKLVIWDGGTTVGFKSALPGGVRSDISDTFGYSDAHFTVSGSANPSLGLGSPTTFNAGTARYWENVTDLTLRHPLPHVLAGARVAAGLEYRYEYYSLGAGQPASYSGSGSSAFPGFYPRAPVANGRNAQAAFVELELSPVRHLSIDGAARYDHYSDFGGAPTWKISARYGLTRYLAFRGSVSTGFRAPSLQQDYYNSLTTVANGANKSLVTVGTYEVDDPVAQALGARPLKPEKSRDESVGLAIGPIDSFAFTADVFRIDIDNRIALSDALHGPAVSAALSAAGITNVQQVAFFTNALNTRTQGYDLSLRSAGTIGLRTRYDLAVAFERSPTEVLALRPNPVLPALPLIGVHARLLLTQAQPVDKLTAWLHLARGAVGATVAVTRYGEYVDAPIYKPQVFSASTIVNLSVNAQLTSSLKITAGVLNVGNVYPDKLQEINLAYKAFGNSLVYGEESPIGTDGRAYFATLRLAL